MFDVHLPSGSMEMEVICFTTSGGEPFSVMLWPARGVWRVTQAIHGDPGVTRTDPGHAMATVVQWPILFGEKWIANLGG